MTSFDQPERKGEAATPAATTTLRLVVCADGGENGSRLIDWLSGGSGIDEGYSLSVSSDRYLELAPFFGALSGPSETGKARRASRRFEVSGRMLDAMDPGGDARDIPGLISAVTNSDVAIIIVDARGALTSRVRRDSYFASLLGIRHAVLAIDNLDLVTFPQGAYEKIARAFVEFSSGLRFENIVQIPVSLRRGDNIAAKGGNMDWYAGPSVMEYLETADAARDLSTGPLRIYLHSAEATGNNTNRVSGTIVSGRVTAGDLVANAKQGRIARVAELSTSGGKVETAVAGQPITILLEDGGDIASGDVLADPQSRPEVADQFAAHLLWVAEDELLPHREYLIRIGSQTVPANVTQLKHRVDVNSLEHLAARTLDRGEVGYCNFSTSQPVAFDRFNDIPEMGGFVVLDSVTKETVGVGMIEFGLRRATNVHWQALEINTGARAELKRQKPCILWFTGLSGSGKSTIANLVEKHLYAEGRHTYILDGDNVRHGLSKDLGFTDADRVENIRRVAEAAKLFVDAGLIVLVSFISPFRSERQLARELMNDGEFIEIFVDTPIETCMARDPKGLYRRAQAGEIKNFTGIDSPYEPPENPDIVLATEGASPDDLAERVVSYLRERRHVP